MPQLPPTSLTSKLTSEDLEVITPSASSEEELTLRELYNKVFTDEDIYIVVDAVDVARIKRGLSDIKNKQNAKLKKNDLPKEDGMLKYKEIEDKELQEGRVRLHVWLDKGEKVKVFGLVVADKELE